MDDVLKIPDALPSFRYRHHLASKLRYLADLIESGAMKHPPHGVVVVLASESKHEVCHVGIRTRTGLTMAGLAVQEKARSYAPWLRRGSDQSTEPIRVFGES